MTSGIQHELQFWANFVKTDRFLISWCSQDKTIELNNVVYDFIKSKLPAKVLDCGSGVVSILTGTVPNDDLTVCDLLGDEYTKIFDYYKYDVVKPFPLACEELLYENEFDIVHISNALDHTQNPPLAYDKLLKAVKPGGYLIIQGFENEGKYENWQGLHQWNLSLDNGKLKINSKKGKIWYKDGAIFTYIEEIPQLRKNWFIFIVQKEV